MKITVTCPRCNEEYTIDEEKVPDKGGKVTCRRCGFKILVQKKEAAATSLIFTVECPSCKHSFEVLLPAPVASKGQGKKTVLLVEDEAFFSGFAQEILEQKYRVLYAGTLKEASAVLRDEKVDLILLDLALSDGDGRSLLKSIEKKCPILIFASRDEVEMHADVWDELRKLGADDVIYKSMNLEEELFHKLEIYLP